MPDYQSEVSRLQLLVDGSPVPIKDETLRILKRRAEARGGRALNTREESGRIQPGDYWVVEGDESRRSVTALREEWKSIWTGEVETKTAAGRSALDARVLAYMRTRTDLIAAKDIEANTGGSSSQVNASLGRLVAAGLIVREGQARGTRYKVK